MSNLFMVILVCCVGVAVIQQFFRHSRNSQRRIYWSSVSVASIAGILMPYPDWETGLWIAATILGAMTLAAYAYTPYIKICGRIFALTEDDRRADTGDAVQALSDDEVSDDDPTPSAYSGMLSAAKMWWLQVIALVISVANIYGFAVGKGEWWVATIGLAFLLFFSLITGYGDGSWGYPVARGQLVQFVILGVITLGTFTVLYLGAYFMAKHRPMRSKHSLENRAHPRLRKTFPDELQSGQ